GVHSATVGGDTVVIRRVSLDSPAPEVRVVDGPTIRVDVATPFVTPNVTIQHVGPRRLATALLLPHDTPDDARLPALLDPYSRAHAQRGMPAGPACPPPDTPDDARRPVLLDPYGGPHAQRVVQAGAAYLTSQWFADQGFAVVVVDGRGTPGRGAAWERGIHGNLADPVLEDQVDGLLALAAEDPRL